MVEQTTPPTADDDKDRGEQARWVQEIRLYEREFGPWEQKCKKIIRRYRDDRSPREGKLARFNILWSNTQTLIPALYMKNPKPNVERRYQDDDDLGRLASEALERAVSYFVHTDKFFDTMRQSVLDRLLPGRGTVWVRYEPVFESDGQVTDDVDNYGILKTENVCNDYVHWEDFGHTWARTWEEVRACWRKVYMTRDAMVKRKFRGAESIPLDYSPEKINDEKIPETMKKAVIYEIWDKEDKKVRWIHKDVQHLLDEVDDPLKLEDFFPCPKPLFATVANDSLIPVPDYLEYQDQAYELDNLTARIASIMKALKVAGVYASDAEGIQRLLAEGSENLLIPVEQWALFAEKGGMKGVMEFLPLAEIAQALVYLFEAREKIKQDAYEITGMSDVIRGQTNPDETATAQEIKGQYAALRLNNMQNDVQRFSRDLVKIMAQIIADHFSIETIKAMSGLKLMTDAEKQQFQMQAQQAQMMAQQTGQQPPPVPKEMQEMAELPSWEQVHALLKDDTMRSFRIDIETDSTIKSDQQAEQQAVVEFLGSTGKFMQEAAQIPIPELQPLLMEMLMFGVRHFRAGKDLESEFKVAMKKLREKADNPAPPPPDPEMKKIEMQGQLETQKLQLEQQKMQFEGQAEQQRMGHENQKLALETEKAMHEAQIKAEELRIKQVELQLKQADLALKEQEMHMRADLESKKIDATAKTAERAQQKEQEPKEQPMPDMNEGLKAIAEAMSRPKQTKVIRGEDGKLVGSVQE